MATATATNKQPARLYARNFDRAAMADQLLTYYGMATNEERSAGLNWYSKANHEIATIAAQYAARIDTTAGIVAALSPSVTYHQNIADTIRLLENEETATVATYGRQKIKALQILWGDNPLIALGGRAYKTRSFYLNLLFPTDDLQTVTIDRHAVRSLLGDPSMPPEKTQKYIDTKNKYTVLSSVYTTVAVHTGLLPQQLQAIIWLVIQRLRDSWTYDLHFTDHEVS